MWLAAGVICNWAAEFLAPETKLANLQTLLQNQEGGVCVPGSVLRARNYQDVCVLSRKFSGEREVPVSLRKERACVLARAASVVNTKTRTHHHTRAPLS